MNITLSADERLIKKARKVAESMGLSLNELVRRYLRGVTSEPTPDEALQELKKLWSEHGGHSGGRKITREEMHERASLSRYEHPRLRR